MSKSPRTPFSLLTHFRKWKHRSQNGTMVSTHQGLVSRLLSYETTLGLTAPDPNPETWLKKKLSGNSTNLSYSVLYVSFTDLSSPNKTSLAALPGINGWTCLTGTYNIVPPLVVYTVLQKISTVLGFYKLISSCFSLVRATLCFWSISG